MKVLIVDDEPIMLLAMKRMLSSIGGVEIVGSFQEVKEVLSFCRNHEVDLAFLDIEIGGEDGIELARNLRFNHADLPIVFTTSHADYAIQAYDIYPLDYMIKPVSKKRLVQTITRAANRSSVSTSPVVNRLKVQALGCLEVCSTHQGPVKWMSKKSEELFAYLLLNRGRSVMKMKVIENIFSNMPFKNAETYLNTATYQLRKALSIHGFKEIIISGKEKYRLNLSQVDVDFMQFEQGVELLSKINNDNEAVARELEKQFVGELLEDQFFTWVTVEREGLNILYASYANDLANWLFTCERYQEALQIGKKIISFDAFNERANRLLLHIFEAMGDKHSLHSHYNKYEQMMKQELDLQPSKDMQLLYYNYK
ncbi:response regulator [Psychrobacillus sp.]|uniref:response regulator n=1 Tax=Psychrobacillus sp. TaxID=1871623 RepID=UPI0028BEFADD|nr:response regulator [Psychrobacillus sp.]